MELNKIKLGCFIREMISRLEKDCGYEDLQEIKIVCSKIWKKHHPIEEIAQINGNNPTAQNNTAFTDISKLNVKPTAQNG